MLREKLQRMIEVEDVAQHPNLLRELSRECPNTIVVIDSEHPIERYTCLVYALGFTERPDYLAIAKYPFKTTYAGPEFARWLIDRRYLRVLPQVRANNGDLVFYFDQDEFKHAAVVVSDQRVISKWGKGHLFEHQILEVPESYGSDIKLLECLPYNVAYDLFVRFVEEHGLIVDHRN